MLLGHEHFNTERKRQKATPLFFRQGLNFPHFHPFPVIVVVVVVDNFVSQTKASSTIADKLLTQSPVHTNVGIFVKHTSFFFFLPLVTKKFPPTSTTVS